MEGFPGSDDPPPGQSFPPPSLDPEDVSTYGEEELVPEPHRVSTALHPQPGFCLQQLWAHLICVQVHQVEINYAKTAKKMDMKRLKSNMWTLLTDSPHKDSQVVPGCFLLLQLWVIDDAVLCQEAVAMETAEVCGEKAFSETTQTLLKRY